MYHKKQEKKQQKKSVFLNENTQPNKITHVPIIKS